jgi:hypothetical protein
MQAEKLHHSVFLVGHWIFGGFKIASGFGDWGDALIAGTT